MKKAFYPPLVATFLVLALFNANAHQLVSPEVVVVPLLIAVGVAVTLWLVMSLVLRSWQKAALPTCVLTVMLLEYGHFRGAFGINESVTLTVWVIALVGMALGTLLIKKPPTLILNVIAICLVLVVLVPFSIFALSTPTFQTKSTDSALKGTSTPDIYYIMMDEYSRNDVLLDMCGFDNSEFTNYLETTGFYVAKNSYAGYPSTLLALASILNMDYMPRRDGNWEGQSLKSSILNSEVSRQLIQRGYTFINIESQWDVIARFENAINLDYNKQGDFTYLFQEMSIIPSKESHKLDIYKQVLFQFDTLKRIPQMSEPTFTFVHIVMTHASVFYFDEDGSFKVYGPSDFETDRYGPYVTQVKVANRMLQEVIETILSKSDAVIILQSDTGPFTLNHRTYLATHDGTFNNIEREDPYTVRARLAILTAFYPDCGVELTAAVNTFRVIFNCHFDTDYALLPDRHFFTMKRLSPYELREVTNALREYIDTQ